MNQLKEQEKKVNQDISKAINDRVNAVTAYAKANHRWGKPYSKGYRPTGKLAQSVTFEYSRKDGKHMAKFFLNDAFLSVDGERSYGTFMHEGTYDGYSRSPIGKPYSHKTGSKGWRADPFLWRAIENEWIKKIDKIMNDVAKQNAIDFKNRMRGATR
jgi:hypothetical protein